MEGVLYCEQVIIMQEQPQFLIGLQWIGGTLLTLIVGLLSALGIGRLLELRAKRRHELEDRSDQLHITNAGKQIDADTAFRVSLIKRIEKLEEEGSNTQNLLREQAVSSARTEEENKHLKEMNKRQEQEIHNQQQEIQKLIGQREKDAIRIVNLESDLQRTQDDLKSAQKLIEDLSRKIDSLPKAMR